MKYIILKKIKSFRHTYLIDKAFTKRAVILVKPAVQEAKGTVLEVSCTGQEANCTVFKTNLIVHKANRTIHKVNCTLACRTEPTLTFIIVRVFQYRRILPENKSDFTPQNLYRRETISFNRSHIDICYRSGKESGEKSKFFPKKIIFIGSQETRNFFSLNLS